MGGLRHCLEHDQVFPGLVLPGYLPRSQSSVHYPGVYNSEFPCDSLPDDLRMSANQRLLEQRHQRSMHGYERFGLREFCIINRSRHYLAHFPIVWHTAAEDGPLSQDGCWVDVCSGYFVSFHAS